MNEIEMLLNELEKLILDGKRKTFSDEISINRQHALAVLHDLKNAVPDRLKEADYIIKNRDQIISDAEETSHYRFQVWHGSIGRRGGQSTDEIVCTGCFGHLR